MIPGTPYLLLGAFLGGLGAGGYGVHTWYQAKRVNALEAARTVERAGVRTAHQADIRYIDRLHEQKGIADARADKFQKAFNMAADSLRRCAVSPELVRLLNESREKPVAGVAAKPESAPSDAQAGSSDCAAVVETYQWNIDNVVVPNQIQIQELQRFYWELRQRFNR